MPTRSSYANRANPRNRRRVPTLSIELRDGLTKLQPELLGKALRLARSRAAADDLVQDTVERAIRFQHRYRADSNLRAWVYQILYNVFITGCRRRRVERSAVLRLHGDPCSWNVPDYPLEMERLSPPVARALETVPVAFRRVVMLVDLEQLTYKDVARQLRVPVGTVMSRLHRGRKAMAEAMRAPEGLLEAA
jgi:RNA polymerase sigma-70 factor, ECF subfamily